MTGLLILVGAVALIYFGGVVASFAHAKDDEFWRDEEASFWNVIYAIGWPVLALDTWKRSRRVRARDQLQHSDLIR